MDGAAVDAGAEEGSGAAWSQRPGRQQFRGDPGEGRAGVGGVTWGVGHEGWLDVMPALVAAVVVAVLGDGCVGRGPGQLETPGDAS